MDYFYTFTVMSGSFENSVFTPQHKIFSFFFFVQMHSMFLVHL